MAGWLASGAVAGAIKPLKDAAAERVQRSKASLSMYTDLPDGEVAIEEFERFAIDRLHGARWGAGWRRRAGVIPGCFVRCTALWQHQAAAAGRRELGATRRHPPLPFAPLAAAGAVLKGIDDLKAKGFRPDQIQEKAVALFEAHMKVRTPAGRLRLCYEHYLPGCRLGC